MHVTLIRPSSMTSLGTYSSVVIPSIGLAYISATLKSSGHNCVTIDAIGEAIDQITRYPEEGFQTRGLSIDEIVDRIDLETDYIGISAMFSIEWPHTKKIITAIREKFPRVPIFLGGEHATCATSNILETCDAVDVCILGEGEETILDLITNFDNLGNVAGIAFRDKHNRILRTPSRKRVKNVDNIERPDWKSIPLENYFKSKYSWTPTFKKDARNIVILATRGCPYECTFCSNPEMWTTQYNVRSPEDVIDELESYIRDYQITGFDFCDLTAVFHKQWIIDFTKILIKKNLGLTWAPPVGTRSEVFTFEVVKLMKDSGCSYINFSPESGSTEVLKRIKKRINLKKMFDSINYCKEVGLPVRINLIAGFPFETRKNIIQTILFQWKVAWAGGDDSIIHFFSPYPGSEIFNDLVKSGKIQKLDDAYYKSLMSYMDLNNMTNYCEAVGMRELGLYRLVGMMGFYALSYLKFPSRIIRTLKVLTGKSPSYSILEQRLLELIERSKTSKTETGIINNVQTN